jgi:FtsP/CotA-like multicopper oxidase with cupredoxin domain
VTLDVSQLTTNNYVNWDFDNVNWTETYLIEPYLVALCRNDTPSFPSMSRALANGGLDNVTRSYPAEIGEVLEIVIQNSAYPGGNLDIHPLHFHGSHFWDLGSGNGRYDAVANEEKWKASTGKPVKRDTTVLYRYSTIQAANETVGDVGWRAWRSRITEPGVWMLHCHVLQHMVM